MLVRRGGYSIGKDKTMFRPAKNTTEAGCRHCQNVALGPVRLDLSALSLAEIQELYRGVVAEIRQRADKRVDEVFPPDEEPEPAV